MSTFRTVSATVQTVIVSLLIDRRAQVAFALTFALVASVLFGGDVAEAKRCIVGGYSCGG